MDLPVIGPFVRFAIQIIVKPGKGGLTAAAGVYNLCVVIIVAMVVFAVIMANSKVTIMDFTAVFGIGMGAIVILAVALLWSGKSIRRMNSEEASKSMDGDFS